MSIVDSEYKSYNFLFPESASIKNMFVMVNMTVLWEKTNNIVQNQGHAQMTPNASRCASPLHPVIVNVLVEWDISSITTRKSKF